MTNLIIASALFFAIHSLVSATGIRGWLTGKIGEGPYMGLFSVVSAGAIIWMAVSYNATQESGSFTLLWDLAMARIDWIAVVLMLPALILVIAGLFSKNPMAVGAGGLLAGNDPATGIMRITRHPFLSGVVIWAIVHLLSNGDLGSVIFFGTFLIVAVIGMASIDRKRARQYDDAWKAFAAKTSRTPFLAIVQGRNSLKTAEIGALRLLGGIVVYAAILYWHGFIFGVDVAASL